MAPELLQLLDANGAGALAYEIAFAVRKYLPFAFLFAAIGLYFFTWWGRPLFVICYAVGFVMTIVGGFAVWPARDVALTFAVTLVDGAILALAFLPPLLKSLHVFRSNSRWNGRANAARRSPQL